MVTMDKELLLKFIKNGQLSLRVIPNAKEDVITYDSEKGVILRLKAQAQDNKANMAVIKYFKKVFGLEVFIHKGIKSKDKILSIVH